MRKTYISPDLEKLEIEFVADVLDTSNPQIQEEGWDFGQNYGPDNGARGFSDLGEIW